MNWAVMAAKLEFGLLKIEEIPAMAMAALEQGEDSPSLRILAGLTASDVLEIENYFADILAEQCASNFSRSQLAWVLVKYYIDLIVAKELSPHDGLHELIWRVYNNTDWRASDKEYVGESIGLQKMYGLCDSYDDILESSCGSKTTDIELLKKIDDQIYNYAVEYKSHIDADMVVGG